MDARSGMMCMTTTANGLYSSHRRHRRSHTHQHLVALRRHSGLDVELTTQHPNHRRSFQFHHVFTSLWALLGAQSARLIIWSSLRSCSPSQASPMLVQDYYTCSREPLLRATMGDSALLPFENISPLASERLEAPESFCNRPRQPCHPVESSSSLFRPEPPTHLHIHLPSFRPRQPICAYEQPLSFFCTT